jgi:hypothetical protein
MAERDVPGHIIAKHIYGSRGRSNKGWMDTANEGNFNSMQLILDAEQQCIQARTKRNYVSPLLHSVPGIL